MKLIRHITPDCILLPSETMGWDAFLTLLAETAHKTPAVRGMPDFTKGALLDAVLDRENRGSTYLGDGFFFPHARLGSISLPSLVFAYLRHPVPYRDDPSRPIRYVCMMLVPENAPTLAIRISSQMTRILVDPEKRARIEAAGTPDAIHDILQETELSLDVVITARDIMSAPVTLITPDMSLKTVTNLMSRHHLSAVEVTDGAGHMLGHITCERLFHYGLPDFFTRLKSVSFINEFDPFERYFQAEANATAADLMTNDYVAIQPTATLLEIVFELTTKHKPKLYVIENSMLLGVVDQGTVLERIINI